MTNNNFDQIENVGVFGVVAPDVLNQTYLNSFSTHNLSVLPQFWEDTTFNHNLIEKYTNSHYTVWEAEGTDPSKGRVTLYRGNGTYIDSNGGRTYVVAEAPLVTNNEEIIFGPGYPQNVTYNSPETGTIVTYTVEYVMKIENRNQQLPQNYLDDVVCTIRVTNLKNDGQNEVPVTEKDVKVSDFNGWGNWKSIAKSYEFGTSTSEETYREFGIKLLPKAVAQCVEFKVIWRGLSYLNLYIDTIRVHDERGDLIVNNPNYQGLVATLVENNINNHTIAGWYGTDEPISIDNYEPYRIVDSIISHVQGSNLRLHAGITGGTTGKFGGWNGRDSLTASLYIDEEFWKRAKPKKTDISR